MDYLAVLIALITRYGAAAILFTLACLGWAIADYVRHAHAYQRATAAMEREQVALLRVLGVLEATLTLYADAEFYAADDDDLPPILADCGSRARLILGTVEAMLEAV